LADRRQLEDVDGETGPVRQCAVSRHRRPISDLLRFVLDPEGCVTPDLRLRLPGRGVWLSADAATVAAAVRTKAFARAFKRPVTLPADLPALVDALQVTACLQSLAMANKAGLITCGFAKIEAALRDGKVSARIEASDGAPDGRSKLDRLAVARHGEDAPVVVALFSAAQLSLALGRENVIHAVAHAGAAGDAFIKRCRGLADYRMTGASGDLEPASAAFGGPAAARAEDS
jgi:predicted RNA-binding protein YlxR (DUF448 family)